MKSREEIWMKLKSEISEKYIENFDEVITRIAARQDM
jgi:hypothetical protein